MNVAIIGSRAIGCINIDAYLPQDCTAVISGGAKGVDSIAAEYARQKGLELIEFLPDYARYGRAATHVRNRSIVDSADLVLAFWDGKSKGTMSTVKYAEKRGTPCHVVEV